MCFSKAKKLPATSTLYCNNLQWRQLLLISTCPPLSTGTCLNLVLDISFLKYKRHVPVTVFTLITNTLSCKLDTSCLVTMSSNVLYTIPVLILAAELQLTSCQEGATSQHDNSSLPVSYSATVLEGGEQVCVLNST